MGGGGGGVLQIRKTVSPTLLTPVVVERGDICPHSLTVVLRHSKITCSVRTGQCTLHLRCTILPSDALVFEDVHPYLVCIIQERFPDNEI